MTPSQAYHHTLTTQGWQADDAQLTCMARFDQHATALVNGSPPVGCYLHGPVGCGKSFCAQLFIDQLTVPCFRQHFHAFMQQVHLFLHQNRGTVDPLKQFAHVFSQQYQLLYLDEFMVLDIADAMILKRLFLALSEAGVYLLVTANPAPHELYMGGYNREAFLPFIEWCVREWDCLVFNSELDYRRQGNGYPAGQYWVSPNHDVLSQHFHQSNPHTLASSSLSILSRDVPCLGQSSTDVWFDFKVLCAPPRCVKDYLVLVNQFNRIWLSDIPELHRPNRIMLFIQLVDVLYEANTGVYLQAEVEADQLYPNGPFKQRLKRTLSRLHALTRQPTQQVIPC